MQETLKFVTDEARQQRIKELMAEGYQWRCLKCNTVFKEKRVELFEDGHGGRSLEMCRCGCDLFQKLSETTCLNVKVKPVDGTLVFKEHHAKYCECAKGKIWTGDSETECRPDLKVLRGKSYPKTYRCSESGLKIVILKSTKEELSGPDELGSVFLRMP